MGIFFTLVYVFVAYLAPTTVFGDLAQYRIEVWIAILAILASSFNASNSGLFKMSETYGVLAMFGCVACSMAFNGLWFIVPATLIGHLSDALPFFLILLNFRTLKQLKLLVATLMAAALFIIYQGASAVFHGDVTSPWVFLMGFGEIHFTRIRGLGILNDPNDLCQFLVGLIPCVFIFWRRSSFPRNFVLVLLPVALLSYGMFLTHSRGGMIGLVVALIVLGRRKFGILPAVITGVVSFIVLSAIGWSGGREISAESGADRMEAWSVGLTLVRTHPFFGVGIGRFDQYFHITAHNTIVVCAAETGVIGLFCWMLMVAPTLIELVMAARSSSATTVADPQAVYPRLLLRTNPAPVGTRAVPHPPLRLAFAMPDGNAAPATASRPFFARPPRGVFSLQTSEPGASTDDEIRRLCNLMVGGLSGFFAAGWFLSRSFTILVFVNIGLALAIHRLGVERGIVPARLPLSKAAKYSGIATIVMIAVVYVMLRITNLLPK